MNSHFSSVITRNTGSTPRAGRAARVTLAVGLAALSGLLALSLAPADCRADHSYPRVGNLFQGQVRLEYAPTFAKWDIVGFTAAVQDFLPQMMPAVRSLNPEVKILAYFPASFIWTDFAPGSPTVNDFRTKISQCDWWLYDNKGYRIGQDGYLWYLNFTTKCPRDGSGQILAQWLGHYIASRIIGTHYWDGVVLDGCEEDIRWLNQIPSFFREPPAGVDCDRDGVADNPDSLYVWWRTAQEIFLATLRADVGPSCIIVPNGNNYWYQYANGGIREEFPKMHGGWQENMFAPYGYIPMCQNYLQEPINATMMLCFYRDGADDMFAPPVSYEFDRFMRLTLVSSLLGDGYYFLDSGAAGSLWWQDHYDLDIGTPTGPAQLETIVNHLDHTNCTVWTRTFTNGKVYCNPFQQYVMLEDNTWLWPNEGVLKIYSLPGPVGCGVRRETLHRESTIDERSMTMDVIVSNPSTKAAMAYVWTDLFKRDGTVVGHGATRELVIGAGQTDTVLVAVGLRNATEIGVYKVRLRIGGPGKTTTDEDTVYIRKVVSFPKDGKKANDGNPNGSDTPEARTLVIYPQPMVLANGPTLTVDVGELAAANEGTECSVKIYDVAGRLVTTAFEGRLGETRTLEIGEGGKGDVPKVPGVYFLQVEAGNKVITKKIVLLK